MEETKAPVTRTDSLQIVPFQSAALQVPPPILRHPAPQVPPTLKMNGSVGFDSLPYQYVEKCKSHG